MFLKDSSGKPSMTATMSIVAFVVVMIKVLFSGAAIAIGSFSYDFGTIDSLVIAALLGPTLGAYTWRRHTAATYEQTDPSLVEDEEGVEPT